MFIPHEAIGVVGLAVIGFIGDAVITAMGKPKLGTAFDIILTVAASVIGITFAWRSIRNDIAPIFGINIG